MQTWFRPLMKSLAWCLLAASGSVRRFVSGALWAQVATQLMN
jgi:hypothetical protein